jgi:nitrite reductase (NADH) small subunit
MAIQPVAKPFRSEGGGWRFRTRGGNENGEEAMAEYMAGKVDDYADGDRKVVVCGDAEVGVFQICQGRIMKRVLEPVANDKTTRTQQYDEAESHIVCPWHGYEFSIKTGFHQGNSRVRLRKAELSIRNGEIYVSV